MEHVRTWRVYVKPFWYLFYCSSVCQPFVPTDRIFFYFQLVTASVFNSVTLQFTHNPGGFSNKNANHDWLNTFHFVLVRLSASVCC